MRSEYYCVSCGRSFKIQKGNFYRSQSPLYKGNDRYLPICRRCLDELFEHYLEALGGDELEAVKRVCMKVDAYFSQDLYSMSRKASPDYTVMGAYFSKHSIKPYIDRNFDFYLDEIKTDVLLTTEDVEKAQEDSEAKITQTAIKRWGMGYSPEEYAFCENLYKMFKLANPRADGVQETFIKDLVTTKVLQQRAFKNDDADKYEKYSKLYQNTLKASKLKMTDETELNNNDEAVCWGNFVKDVEQYTPAELYTEKKLFDDVDGIKEYFKRFIVRPFKNFFTGSNVLDEEFSILPGDDDA